MLFVLTNVGVAFQRVMDHAFKDLIEKFMVDYLDDLTMHSKIRHLHLKHLREVFIRYRMFRISLNANKCLIAISEGWLLGQIVNSKGIYIDPKRIQDINELKLPTSCNDIWLYFRKINFIWIFILDYASIVNPIKKILKKVFEWTHET